MKKLKKAATGILTLALSFSIVGTSVAPTFADDTGKNLEELQEAVAKAQEEYDAAETAYDNGAVKFLESKMCDYHKNNFTVEKYEENIKNYTTGKNADLIQELMDKRDKFFTKEDGSPDVEKRKRFKQSWITFDNLKLQATWLDELNERRAGDKNKQAFEKDGKSYSQKPVKLNAEFIMDAMMSSLVSYYDELEHHHVLFDSKASRTYVFGSENLARGFQDPLTGWYDFELEDYNEGHRELDYVGHYQGCMRAYDYVGFGMYGPRNDHLILTAMRSGFSENWIPTRIEETGYTSEEWLKEVNAYEAPYKKNLDEAKSKLDNTKKALRDAVNPGNSKPDFSKADVAKKKAAKLNKSDYIIGFPPVDALWYDVEDAMKELDKVYKTASKETSEKESEIQKKLEDASTVNDLKAIYQDEAECYAEIQQKLDAATDKLNNAMSKLNGTSGGSGKDDNGNTDKPDNGNTDKPNTPDNGNKDDSNTKQETILSKMALSATKCTYNGKTHTPSVKVYDQKGKMLSADRYTVKYSSGRKNLGSYTVSVYGKGDVTGTASAKYVITPAKMKTPSVKAGKKKITVKWKKLGGGSQSYQIYVLKKGTKKAKYYTSTGSSKTIKKLSKKKYYYTKIRSYKKINGKTYYGSWSGTKKVKVK